MSLKILCAIVRLMLQFYTPAPLGAQATALPTSLDSVGGLVDIGGGRHIYLECHGSGSPTVVLEVGYRSSARHTSCGKAVHHCPISEHGQIKTMPIEGDQLRSQLADFSMKSRINWVSDLPGVGCSQRIYALGV